MIEETGRVVAVENGAVWVESIRRAACKSCAARKGCGQSALAKLGQQKKNHVKALNNLNLQVGDSVVIGVPEDIVVKGTFIAYLMPLLLMLVAAVVAESLSSSDLVVSMSSIAGLLVGFGMVRLHFLRIRGDQRYQPLVLRLSKDQEANFCPTEVI